MHRRWKHRIHRWLGAAILVPGVLWGGVCEAQETAAVADGAADEATHLAVEPEKPEEGGGSWGRAMTQVLLIQALGDRGDAAALAAVTNAAQGSDAEVRLAALGALGALGDVSTVPLLVKAAAGDVRPERDAARASLDKLRGEGVDGALAKWPTTRSTPSSRIRSAIPSARPNCHSPRRAPTGSHGARPRR